jgi:single-strand DNA-binding protein
METQYETFMGRLGQKPELRYTPKSEPVCNFSVAIYQGKDVPPIWKKVVVWGKQAELCSVQLNKGSDIFVQGRHSERSFEIESGETKTYSETNARLVGFTNV